MPSVGIPSGSSGVVRTKTAGDVVDFIDAPSAVYIDASSNNIPASGANAELIVTALASAVTAIQCIDTTGELIGLFSAVTVGIPPLCVFGPGSDSTTSIQIAAGSALYLRNMKNAAITVGDFALNFIG